MIVAGIVLGFGLSTLLRVEPAIAQPATPSGGGLWPYCTGVHVRGDGGLGPVLRCWSDGRVEMALYEGTTSDGVMHWSTWHPVKP